MNSFDVFAEMMTLFYRGFTESVLIYCIIAWFGNINLSDKSRLGGLVKTTTKISRRSQTNLSVIYDGQVLRTANAILVCPTSVARCTIIIVFVR